LWITRFGRLNEKKIPKCEQCGSRRIFEFQVNPQLLNYLKLDETKQISNSVDWAGIYVYTCAKSCQAANGSYVEEFIYKQDFVS
jgi:pre-rRNA-processing protein TSR4